MKVLFVLKRPGVAGVETLALRLIREMIQGYGDTVGLLLLVNSPSPSFFKSLDPKCKVFSALTPGVLKQLNQENFDIIYGFETFGLLFGGFFLSKLKSRPKLCLGGYHPLEYSWQPAKKSFLKNFILKYFKSIPHTNLTFMNEEVLGRAQKNLGDLGGAHVIPLPIDSARFAKVQRQPDRQLIVSLGRLADFKTYNLQMITAIHELNKKGIRLEYHVYGDGELKEPMTKLINQYGLQSQVRLMGSLPYEEIENIFSRAYCFVGCGTSLVEAAATGLPTLVATESAVSPNETYGFFTDISGFNVGEWNPNWPQYRLLDKIEQLLNLAPEQYDALAHAHATKARSFDLHSVTGQYRQVFAQAQSTPLQPSLFAVLAWTTVYFFYKVLDRFKIKTPLQNRYKEI